MALLRAADRVRRRLDDTLRPRGITPQQYNVLRILRGAGPGGLPTLTVAARMLERTPGITGLIDRLAAKALVERCDATGDRRKVMCRITPAGLTLLADLDSTIEALDQAATAALGPPELTDLTALLTRVLPDGQPDGGVRSDPEQGG